MEMLGGCALIITQPAASYRATWSCSHLYPHVQSVLQVLQLADSTCYISEPCDGAAGNGRTQLGLPAELTKPAPDTNCSTDHVTQLMSDIAAVQLPQQQPEAHEPHLDCQGLQLLSNDRPLHWEAFVRQQQVLAAGGSNRTLCKFLDDAALADCKACAMSGGLPDQTCSLPNH